MIIKNYVDGTHKDSIEQWGDLGDGTYKNPVLFADYSDPDICRVESDFYMVCSEFNHMGMPVMQSKDLVNWTIIGKVYDRLDLDKAYDSFGRYGRGSWAPSLRHHEGKFYVYFCTPDEGLFMSTAERAEGPWSPLHCVQRIVNWEDPCPFWDDDGKAYLGHGMLGAGPIIVHKMNPDGRSLLDEGITVYTGPVAEGPKFHKRNGYYYLSIPEGGVGEGNQVALRSKHIYGPYDKKVVLEKGSTKVNGPHQGGIVELESGESWFIHFQEFGAWGRILHLQPVNWVDDWPLMGNQVNGQGEPVSIYRKPNVGSTYSISTPQTNDDFDSNRLGLQWGWNHNPIESNWSLTERPGWMRLKSAPASSIKDSHNTLLQKLMGWHGEATVLLDPQGLASGQVAGLCQLGGSFAWIGVEVGRGNLVNLKVNVDHEVVTNKVLNHTPVWLRISIDRKALATFSYSLDGANYEKLFGKSQLIPGDWKGAKLGLFSYHSGEKSGDADFDSFTYIFQGPQ